MPERQQPMGGESFSTPSKQHGAHKEVQHVDIFETGIFRS
jgi:hypothetical protein